MKEPKLFVAVDFQMHHDLSRKMKERMDENLHMLLENYYPFQIQVYQLSHFRQLTGGE